MGKFSALRGGLDFETPQKMFIKHPVTGLPLRFERDEDDGQGGTRKVMVQPFIELFSDDSKKAKSFDRQRMDLRLTSRKRPKSEELESEAAEKSAFLTANWLLITPDGDVLDLPCTEAEAVALYTEEAWLHEQVIEFRADRGNFKSS